MFIYMYVLYTDDWKVYDDLILNGYNHYYRIFHHRNEFSRDKITYIIYI